MKALYKTIGLLCFLLLLSCSSTPDIKISGELKTWHKVTLEIAGPQASESDAVNPFLDYRLQARFILGEESYIVPGYFAADGNAGESSSVSGNSWKVHFTPSKSGTWSYSISFRKGKNIAISEDHDAGESIAGDGQNGTFTIRESDKEEPDFRAKGRLQTNNSNYLVHAGSGEAFIKGGAGSPENLLAYKDFDATYFGGINKQRSGEDAPNKGLHAYEAHTKDWKEGDPTWKDGKGKGIIGAINYLSSKGMNSVYFLTLNILGDGEDVWPYTDRNERYRFDCSKLDQWEILFSHMDQKGILMHLLLQETENEHMLDAGYLDAQRKLYIRELVARFSHHNAIQWDLGEEHGPVEWMPYFQSIDDTKKMADYIRATDPYDHLITIHTHPNAKNRQAYLPAYLDYPSVQGPSIQAGNPMESHSSTLYWLDQSERAGYPWVVSVDEIGQHWKGALPDAVDPSHDTIRKNVLWGTLMAGGAGVEWYFGYSFAHADLNCEDWRSRDILWDQTRYALEFFQNHLPFQSMRSMDELVTEAWCLGKNGEVYAVYYPEGISSINLSRESGSFRVRWYNPRTGGKLVDGNTTSLRAGMLSDPGLPPSDASKDWVCLLSKEIQ